MTDDVQQRLEQLTARGAPPELRIRVLAAVAAELPRRAGGPEPSGVPQKRRRLTVGWLVAASLALAAVLNVWIHCSLDRRMMALLGPAPVNRQAALLAADVASVTDRQTGQWAYNRLTAAPRRPVAPAEYAARLEAALHQFTQDIKELRHAAIQEDPQVDRHRSGRDDCRAVGVERLVRLEHRHAIGKANGRVA